MLLAVTELPSGAIGLRCYRRLITESPVNGAADFSRSTLDLPLSLTPDP